MKNFVTLLFVLFSLLTTAQTSPNITSWMLNTTGITGYNNQPANVQAVHYTSSTVYVSCSDIPAYDIGPWVPNPNTATDQHFVYAIPRTPAQNTGNPIQTPLGHAAVWVNGVSVFNSKDANSYNNMNVWHSNAVVVEANGFDECLGHPDQADEYHHHQNPRCLYDATDSTQHSPILGFSFDGYPIYGPYAYANTDGTGGIRRMRSSFQKRNITTRTTLANGTVLSAPQYGPAVSSSYPLGYYIEDFEYVSGSGDLDAHNGRFCVTPEYPNGTYAYFVTIDSTGASAYPYVIGPTYYGVLASGDIGPNSAHNVIPDSAANYVATGLREARASLPVSIVPNPTAGEVQIALPASVESNVSGAVYNALGKEVRILPAMQPGASQTIDLSNLPGGIYFLRLQNKTSTSVKQIVLK